MSFWDEITRHRLSTLDAEVRLELADGKHPIRIEANDYRLVEDDAMLMELTLEQAEEIGVALQRASIAVRLANRLSRKPRP